MKNRAKLLGILTLLPWVLASPSSANPEEVEEESASEATEAAGRAHRATPRTTILANHGRPDLPPRRARRGDGTRVRRVPPRNQRGAARLSPRGVLRRSLGRLRGLSPRFRLCRSRASVLLRVPRYEDSRHRGRTPQLPKSSFTRTAGRVTRSRPDSKPVRVANSAMRDEDDARDSDR